MAEKSRPSLQNTFITLVTPTTPSITKSQMHDGPYPLLPVAILQVVDVTMVPVNTDTHECPWEEAIFSHNNKVSKKTSKSLDHPCK